MILSRHLRATRKSLLLPGLAAAAVMTSGLALGIAPAHAEVTVTPWQLGITQTISTVLSADGSQVYALGTITDSAGNPTFVLDTVNTTSGAVTQKTLDLPGSRTTVNGVETQVDGLVVSPDGTVFADGYVNDTNGTAGPTGTLWRIDPGATSPASVPLAGLMEGSTLALTDDFLVVGGLNPSYAPAIMEGLTSSFASASTTPTAETLPVDPSATSADVDTIAVGGTTTNRIVWVAGRSYSGPSSSQTVSNVLWNATEGATPSAPRPLANAALSMTADAAGNAYVGEDSWDASGNFHAEGVQTFPATGGSATSTTLGGEVPSHLSMSPDDAKVVGVGSSGAFAFTPATPDDLSYTYAEGANSAGTISDLAFSATAAYAVVYGYPDYAPSGTLFLTPINRPWVPQQTTTNPEPPPAPPGNHPTPVPPAPPAPPAPHLTPAQQKVANAKAKVTKTLSAIAQAKAQARAAKQAHNVGAEKKLANKIASLQHTLKQQKTALATAKKALKKKH